MFDDFFAPALGIDDELSTRNWNPSADVYEEDNQYVIKAALPGIDKKNIHVDVENNVLILKGEQTEDKELKEENYYRKEMAYGKFQRSFALPEGVDTDSIKADYSDGVIKITIPKPETKQPQKITVQ